MAESRPDTREKLDDTDARKHAEAILAKARADCVAAGTPPLELAEAMLQEALLAMMVYGLSEDECTARLQRFTEETVTSWFEMAAHSTERCDCAREHMSAVRETSVRAPDPVESRV